MKRYFVVALDTDDEREAIKTAWGLHAKFVFDAERMKLATIVTTKEGSKLVTYTDGHADID